MLVPPQIIERPGANGSPTTACPITGNHLPADGPYACVAGVNYSRQAIAEIGRALGLFIKAEAQERVERMLAQAAEATETAKQRGKEVEELKAALAMTRKELETVTAERDALSKKLSTTRSSASITNAAVKEILANV